MCHVLGTEMIHFIHQMQYYITFEVRNSPTILVECLLKVLKLTASWAANIPARKHAMVGINSLSQITRTYRKVLITIKYFEDYFRLNRFNFLVFYRWWQVLECCWADLKKQVAEASDLDHIIAAHETFLDQVLNRCLLDTESRVSLFLL